MRALAIGLLALGLAAQAHAEDIVPSYSVPGYPGRVGGVVTLCPSADGTHTAVACGTAGAPTNVTIVGPDGPEGGVSVSINPFRMNANNQSGAHPVGGAWHQVFPQNLLRTRVFFENYCYPATQGITTTESLFIAVSPAMPADTPMALPGPVEMLPCGSYDSSSAVVGTAPVWVWAATTGHHFVALEW